MASALAAVVAPVLLLVVGFTGETIAEQTSGPYDIVLHRIDACDDSGTGQIKIGTRMNSRGHNVYTYTSNLTFDVPWDHMIKTDVEIQQLRNGAYVPKFITMSFKNCEKLMKVAIGFFTDILKAANYTVTGCPIPAGNYQVRDWVVKMEMNNIPTMFYNSYKMIVSMKRARVRVGCFKLYVDAVPKTTAT